YGDLSVKMGRMAGSLGYEQVPPMANFFYSHSYTYCYGEPVLITGMMATYALNDQVNILAGFHQGMHEFEQKNDRINFQGGVKWTSRDGRTELAYVLDAGRNDVEDQLDQYIHSIVFQRQLSRRTTYVFQTDYSHANMAGGAKSTEYYSVVNYLFYQLNRKWSAGMRAEWFRDQDGTRVMGVGNLPDARGWMGALGYKGSFTELTVGLNYKPRSNILVRPELRWDWYAGDANPNGPYPYPFDDGTKKSQFTAACDFVWMF
ncbi:MAG: outer membrane beta-barrel protein, partial [Pirellulaceae bacterium]|nr:outer membrane beta-barrel protein [Pirellulaceae bacterium]